MKIYFTLLFLFCISVCISQQPRVKNRYDSLKENASKKPTFDTSLFTQRDTITIKDSVELTNEKSNHKIVIAKGEGSSDNFKYIFPIITLILGIAINKFLDALSERKKIKRSGERWAAEIRCLEEPLRNQILALEIFRNEHSKEVWDIPDLQMQTILNCEIFKTLDKADLIKHIKRFKNKTYSDAILTSNHIHGFISILTSNYESLQKKFEEYMTARGNYTTSYSKNLSALMKAFANYQVALENELNKDVANEPRFAPIATLFDEHILPNLVTGNYDIYVLDKEFFLPLVQILAGLRHDPKINEMSDAIRSCLSDSKAIKMEKQYLTQNLVTLTFRYGEALEDLPKIVQDID
jgi:hypothetical protein